MQRISSKLRGALEVEGSIRILSQGVASSGTKRERLRKPVVH